MAIGAAAVNEKQSAVANNKVKSLQSLALESTQYRRPVAIILALVMLVISSAKNKVKSLQSLAFKPTKYRRPVVIIVALVMLVISTVLITVGVSQGNRNAGGNQEMYQDEDTIATITSRPSSSPSDSPTIQQDLVMNNFLVGALGFDDRMSGILVAGSAQWKAKRWLVQDDPIGLDPSDDSVPEWRILQRYAIVTLQFSLIGNNEFNLDWMSMDECESVHINCDDDGFVRALEIDQEAISGTIPDEIALLWKLENLIMKNNRFLTGTLPDAIKNNTALRQIGLHNNSLTGTLPDGIYKLPLLTYLNLSDNHFSGSLSKDLGQLTKLEKLILDNNDFTGHLLPLPLRRTQINVLSLSGNRFNSNLVPAMRFLHNLEYLYLDNNEFMGSLPSFIGSMNQLRSLSLSQNQFTGTLPIELGELSNLRYLNIAENSFRGQLHESMVGNFTKLEILSLEQNNFTGTLPRSFGYLSSLGALNYTWMKHGIDIGQ